MTTKNATPECLRPNFVIRIQKSRFADSWSSHHCKASAAMTEAFF